MLEMCVRPFACISPFDCVCVHPAPLLLQITKQTREDHANKRASTMRAEAELAAQKQLVQNPHQEQMREVGEYVKS